MVTRRDLLTYTSFSMALAALGFTPEVFAAQRLKLGSESPFSYDALVQRAKESAAKPYHAPAQVAESALANINYDVYRKIIYNPDYALFNTGVSRFPVTFFSVNSLHRTPVKMSVVENNHTREIIQSIDYFTFPDNAHGVSPDLKGNVFSGFRILENQQLLKKHSEKDWVSFIGASYFRAVGEQGQFGLSARGIAINTVLGDTQEEFPEFTHFWFETPQEDSNQLVVYALLDGPSICGAYRFVLQRTKGVVMDVDCSLFLRQDVGRLGIAPQTSMFWFSKMAKGSASDWRPEVHDSDGLAMWTGKGEHIWRPLNNPLQVRVSAFNDNNPRGFGLLQKDRDFKSYLGSVGYERRPDLWIEPKGEWGEGAVQLVEIPTDDEIYDNIVAMWVPKQEAKAGSEHQFSYRLHWLADEPYPSTLARCGSTRLGRGGNPGAYPDPDARKFIVEYRGEVLDVLPADAKPEAVIWASRGTIEGVKVEKAPGGQGNWRAVFDLHVEGKEPVELRLFLKEGDKTLSETWMYQYLPFRSSPRPLQGI
ncbi:glucan biosynthesis protein D [Rouxiella silvae]|uniref:Glucans biosynthesis protein D n=1 Tax=Rouxiella silvae TaxID=1646373 RepID=A0AA40X5Z4_9GAMM|nr:glucan biosynthesis protein D [Rouxiella silvae]MBF6638989.1 glucan biosynthesis protein D [Rouxiella silvae]ORJ21297.1 glucan biosynthesis protein D [Rouxiella silvae]